MRSLTRVSAWHLGVGGLTLAVIGCLVQGHLGAGLLIGGIALAAIPCRP